MCLQCGRSRRSQVTAGLSELTKASVDRVLSVLLPSLPTSWPASSLLAGGHLRLTQACPPLQPPALHGEGMESLCPPLRTAESDAQLIQGKRNPSNLPVCLMQTHPNSLLCFGRNSHCMITEITCFIGSLCSLLGASAPHDGVCRT